MRALERFTERLIERQRELYASDEPFVEKWRTAMRYLVSEDVTYEKVWLELQALAWNNAGSPGAPRARERGVERGADRGVRGAASRARNRDAAGRARLARDDLQHRASWSSAWAASRRGTASSWTGSTDGCRAERTRARADARALPRRVRLRRARRRAASTTRSTAPASRPSCCCRPGRSSTRATGRCRSPTSPGTAAC